MTPIETDCSASPLLIVAAGKTFADLRTREGDFADWITAGLETTAPVRCEDATETDAPLPDPATLAGVIVTGSHAMVTDHDPWSERLAHWLRRCVQAETPVLGICYGHQLLAYAMGGQVGYHPGGLELGTHDIHLHAAAGDDDLFRPLPPSFPAQLVHAQSVMKLPPGAVLLAGNTHDPHQAYRVGEAAWGVQFHPEFSAVAMRFYIDAMRAAGANPQLRYDHLMSGVQPACASASLLRRFAQLTFSHQRNQQSNVAPD